MDLGMIIIVTLAVLVGTLVAEETTIHSPCSSSSSSSTATIEMICKDNQTKILTKEMLTWKIVLVVGMIEKESTMMRAVEKTRTGTIATVATARTAGRNTTMTAVGIVKR